MQFDPLADPAMLSDFESQQQEVLRQVKLAEMLRRRALESQSGPGLQGQMVSGHYIAPHWTQQLAAVINPLMQQQQAQKAEEAAAQKQTLLRQALGKAQQDWMSQMPQGTPGQPAQMSPEVQGNNPSAFQPAQEIAPATAAKPPGLNEQMRWLAQGAQIPGNSPLAMTLGKMMGEERTREDAQQARREQAGIEAALRLQQKQMEIQGRLQQAAMEGASRQQLQAMLLEGRKEIAAMANDAKQERAASADEDRLQRSAERLGNAATAIAPLVTTGQAVQDMLDRYATGAGPGKNKPRSIPGVGYESLLAPPALRQEANVNRATLQRFANAVARSEIGLSQTLSEQAQQALSNMSNGKFSEDEFRAAWPEILAKANASIQNLHGAYGPKVIERYNSQGGNLRLIQSKTPVDVEAAEKARRDELRKKAQEGATPQGTW